MPKEDRPLRYRELVARLKHFGVTEVPTKGRGAVRKFVGVVEGRKQGFVLHAHSEHDEIARHYLRRDP